MGLTEGLSLQGSRCTSGSQAYHGPRNTSLYFAIDRVYTAFADGSTVTVGSPRGRGSKARCTASPGESPQDQFETSTEEVTYLAEFRRKDGFGGKAL